VVLVLKALLGDIALTKLRRDLRRLNQRMALLESDQPLARDTDLVDASQAQATSPEARDARRSAAS
jgi:hypothetical protein